MKTDLATLFFLIIFASALLLPGFGNYVNQRYERDLKIACINTGENLIEGSYINEN